MFKLKILVIIVLLNVGFAGFSQRTTFGILNGINYSDINNSSVTGKWQSMTGPLAGLYFNYKLNKFLALNTEINYLTLYYQYKSYHNPYYYPLEYHLSSSIMCYAPLPPNQTWSFSYLRLPVMLKFYTPTRLSFHLSAGGYISQMIANNRYYYPDTQENNNIETDFGLMFASGISYNLMNKLNLNLEIRYAAGKSQIMFNEDGMNGDMEISLGVGYTFLSKKKKEKFSSASFPDTLTPKLSVKYSAGANISQNFGKNKEKYVEGIGFTGGLSLIYHPNKTVSLQTDILFQRNSFALSDSSSSFFYYKPGKTNYFVDTKTDIDYINIPVIINVFLDKKSRFYTNVGLYTSIRMNARVVGLAYSKIQTESEITHLTTHVYDNIKGEIESSDWGWLAGIGFQAPVFKKYKLDINMRYESSFINICADNPNSQDINLHSLSLAAGIIIPIK